MTVLEDETRSRRRELHQKAHAFEVQLDAIRVLTRLSKTEAFRFFRQLVNYDARTRRRGAR